MMRTNGSAGMRGGAMWQRYQRDLTVLMTHNTVQPELAADSFGRMHFGLLPHGFEAGAGPPAAAGALSATLADPMTHISVVVVARPGVRG